jgi:PAS domain S-box-containing protein
LGPADKYFRDLFENTSDLIHYANVRGDIELANPIWLKTLGYSLEDVKGKSIYEFIADKEVSAYQEYRDQCIKEPIQENFQTTFKGCDGSKVIVEGHIRPFFADGKLLHTRGVFRNITIKKELEIVEKEQLLKVTQFLENAPDAVIIINEYQLIAEWNFKATEIFGYSRLEVIYQDLSALIIPIQFREAHHKGMKHFLATGEGPVLNKTIEVPAMTKSGREFPISLSISSVRVNDEWFFIAFISDISERKNNEQVLLQKDRELEITKAGENRNKEFLTIASHELKTPLTSIKAYIQLALRGINNQPLEDTINFLRKAEHFSDKLGKLILNLLDVSKIQSGKLLIQKQPIDIKKFLQEIVSASQLLYPSHKIFFTPSTNNTIDIDPSRIEQVIVNLINNAVKYSPKATEVDVKLEKHNNLIYISIKDYGVGIQAKNQRKVFDKFYRIDELSKNDTQGLGIGLYVSSEIVKQHGGKIWVENNEDKGATFFVILPING